MSLKEIDWACKQYIMQDQSNEIVKNLNIDILKAFAFVTITTTVTKASFSLHK